MERGFSRDEWLLPFALNDLVDRNIYKVSIDWIFHIDKAITSIFIEEMIMKYPYLTSLGLAVLFLVWSS